MDDASGWKGKGLKKVWKQTNICYQEPDYFLITVYDIWEE